MLDWVKRRWEVASSSAVLLGGLLRIFAPESIAAWGGWAAIVFFLLTFGKLVYDRSPRLQAILARARHAVGVDSSELSESSTAFRGLLPFREGDAAEFSRLGRQADIAALLPALRDPELRVLVLRGDSGSGKTSLIRAGLVPVLRAEGWEIVDVDPEASDPVLEIRRALSTTEARRLLLIADQFEEHFLGGSDRSIGNVLRETIERKQAKWLIGVRADFKYLVDDLVETYRGTFEAEFLKPRVGYGLRLFTSDEAARVISEIGTSLLQPGVAHQLAQDLSRGGRVLPADIQFVGFEMQERGIRTLDEYRKSGGRDGIVAASIRDVIEQFTGEDRKTDLRKILSALIDHDTGTRLQYALSSEELATRAGVGGRVEPYCEPFVRRRVLRVSGDSGDSHACYRLAHDYLVQPIYTAIGHTETDYEKALRLLTLYAGEYSRNPHARIPRYDYRLIRRLLRKLPVDANLTEARRRAKSILEATARQSFVHVSLVAVVGALVVLFLPPIRGELEGSVTRMLNQGVLFSRPKAPPKAFTLGNVIVTGMQGRIFRYGALPFLERIPIPEMVKLSGQAAAQNPSERRIAMSLGANVVAIGRLEVTVAQFNVYLAFRGRKLKEGAPNLPVAEVSWSEASNYCDWLSQVTGMAFHLPTEAEWEYACRGKATVLQREGGLEQEAWYFDNADASRHPVGTRRPNGFGIFDMRGNIEEWCGEWDEEWGLHKTCGGGFVSKSSEAQCDTRVDRDPNDSMGSVGFRCALGIRSTAEVNRRPARSH